ncbi:MAG TPA: AtpZ/AtpI family protein [Terriglobales bacterium]|nr:AtpZ/AtpI family protein [Terriglobales bacterium]
MPQQQKEAPKSPGEQKLIASLARYSEIGFIIPSAVVLGFFLGKLLDYWLHTHWIYLAGLIFGAVVGFVQMIRMALISTKEE